MSLDLAIEKGVSVYDASYAMLASGLGIPLMTADRKLIGRLEGSGVEVRWLGDYLRAPVG